MKMKINKDATALASKDIFLSTKIDSVKELVEGEEEKLIIKGFANTTDLDRAGDIIVESAWGGEALVNYLKNPIILAFHNHSQPIGVMVDYSVTAKGLEITAEISAASGNVYQLIKQGILQAFSVGFRVLDANYDSDTDIFVIKEVELHEVSVVSVPCNQNSIFSVSKSFESREELAEFKTYFTETPTNPGSIEPNILTKEEDATMDPEELARLEAQKQEDIRKAVADALAEQEAIRVAREKAIDDAEKEKARIAELISSGTEALVEDLTKKYAESMEEFNGTVEGLRTELSEKSDEITALQRSKQTFHSRGAELTEEHEKDICDAVLMSKILEKDVLETKAGQEISEKVNTASSFEVSSIGFETIFSNNLEHDIDGLLVMAPLFREVNMISSTLTLPISPANVYANWVNPTAYGTAATTGTEVVLANTEVTLTTKKLAAKAFIVDETNEDVLAAIMPIVRDSLVESQALGLDKALIQSTGGSNDPIGIIQRAATAGGVYVTEHTKFAAGGSLIAAKDLIIMRRALGQRGLTLGNLALVVNLDCYWDLLEDPAFDNLNEVGSQAHLLTGQVGKLHGLPVQVSTEFPTVANGSVFAMLIDKTNFLLPRQRGMTVQTDYDVETQSRILVATQRVGLQDIIDGVAAATMTYDADGV